MGRWLDALKKHENGPEANLQNPQKYPKPIFEGFEGACSGKNRKISNTPEAISKVLNVPASGDLQNDSGEAAHEILSGSRSSAIQGGDIVAMPEIATPRHESRSFNTLAALKAVAPDTSIADTDLSDIKCQGEGQQCEPKVPGGKALAANESRTAKEPCAPASIGNSEPDTKATPEDAELYAKVLLLYGPASYGMAMRLLGWGATRSGQAKQALYNADRITFNQLGWAVLKTAECNNPMTVD